MKFKESETIELKEIVTKEIKKEIVAFANSYGGKLYIGVKDDGTVIGLKNFDETSLQIINIIRDSIKPDLSMFVRYNALEIEGKKF
jgi:ATP-dependent DNA helicase RecG